jgi:uncharacterized cupin superfamily protein
METYAHVKGASASWSAFAAQDATHDQLVGLSDALETDAVWLVRRDPESTTRVALSQAGLYRIPVGEFAFESPGDEMCYVIAGAADIEVAGGGQVRLERGDMVFWPRGTRTSWTVTEDFVQFFTMIG